MIETMSGERRTPKYRIALSSSSSVRLEIILSNSKLTKADNLHVTIKNITHIISEIIKLSAKKHYPDQCMMYEVNHRFVPITVEQSYQYSHNPKCLKINRQEMNLKEYHYSADATRQMSNQMFNVVEGNVGMK